MAGYWQGVGERASHRTQGGPSNQVSRQGRVRLGSLPKPGRFDKWSPGVTSAGSVRRDDRWGDREFLHILLAVLSSDVVTLADYLPIGIMLVLATGFVAVSLIFSRMVRPDRPTPEKLDPYECGIVPLVEPVQRFPVKFYLVAMLFVIFDIEIIFLFAWASIWTSLGWYGVAAILIFTFFVAETLAYVWKRGALDWNIKRRARYIPVEGREAA